MNTVKNDLCGYTNLLNSAIKELLSYPPDITIFAQDGKLEVNRLLFSMYSPTLDGAISHWVPSSSILLPDYSIASVRILIDLLENGFSAHQHFPAKDFQNVLEIANHLRIQLNNNNVQVIENDITKPKLKQIGESSIDEVTSKGSKGAFNEDKFISGKSVCEKLSGSKANKFQQSLRVNGKQLIKATDPNISRQATPSVQPRRSVNLIKGKSRINSTRIPQFSNLAKSERFQQVGGPTAKLRKQEEDRILNKKDRKDALNPFREVNVNVEKKINPDITHRSNVNNIVNFTSDEENDFASRPVFVAIEDNIPNVDENSTLHIQNAGVKDNSANMDNCFAENSVMKSDTANIDQSSNEAIESKADFEQKSKLPKAASQTKQLHADDTSNDFTKPKLNQDGENSIYEVTCKESVGEFHQDKYINGGKGPCILFNGTWLTPNEFERQAGSRARKYKSSLKVNGKPIGSLIDPSGTRPTTPSVQQKPSDHLNNGKSSKISQLSNLVKSETVKGNQPKQSVSLKRSNAQINSVSIPQFSNLIKTESVQGNQLMGSTSKLRKPGGSNENKENYMNPPRDEGNKKRKKQFNKGNDKRNTNSKKIQLDKMYESVGASSTLESDRDEFLNTGDDLMSNDEINLSGTPVFMALQDNIANLDESYSETILMKESTSNMDESYIEDAVVIDLSFLDNYGSPIVSKTKIKQINDNDVAEMVDLGQFEKQNSSNESTDADQFASTKRGDKFPKPDAKKENSRFSEDQTSGLRKAFNENNFLSKGKAYTLSQELCLTEKQIRAWFNNSRAKKRLSIVSYKSEEKMKVMDEFGQLLKVNQKYSCELCSKSFVNKSKLIKHMSSHGSDAFKNDKTNDTEIRKDDTNFEDETHCRCDCGAICKNALLLKFHKNEDCVTASVKQGV